MTNSQLFSELSPCVIVGGSGRMGEWFASLFRACGITVDCLDERSPSNEWISKLEGAATAIVTVPIHLTCEVMGRVISSLNPAALLADLTSIKSPVLKIMKTHPGEVIGLHPMCAPTKQGLNRQTVIWCEERGGARSERLRNLLEHLGAEVVPLSDEKHDRLMSLVQIGNHFQSVVLAYVAQALGISAAEALKVASPIYKIRMQLMGRILAQEPALYVDMFRENPCAREVLQLLEDGTTTFKSLILSEDRDRALDFFRNVAEGLGDYPKEALFESDALLEYVTRSAHKS
jgi:prephenate dehydrogenase